MAAPLGPVSAAAIREGLERGALGTFRIGLGAATVDFLYFGLVYVGVAPLLLRLPGLVVLFYVAGALLLGQMAYGALRRAAAGGLPKPAPPGTARSAYLYGLGITVLNPATIISWLGMGGAFASAYLRELAPLSGFGVLVAVFTGSVFWFGVLALLVGGARRLAGERPWVFRLVNLVAGVALGGFAIIFMIKAVRG